VAIFVDTSGFIAGLDPDDPFHNSAARLFIRARNEHWELVTTNYIIHESWALMQRRFGWGAVDDFLSGLLPLCRIIYVGEEEFRDGERRCGRMRRRLLSVTDCISFEVMSNRGILEAIAFDRHFDEQGFNLPK
jgi:predicted nucleic acid-binding protein